MKFLHLRPSPGVSIQSKRPSVRTVLSCVLPSRRTEVLFRIRDLVTTPNYTPSAVIHCVTNSCASALSAAEFPDILQSRNIAKSTFTLFAPMSCALRA